ncbi:MAG: zinc transporter, family [Thermoleophilaceae bacterium]|nr:zinc transporter, family [Thermoleophilaceae bacterium]MEA2349674.1 zinc transporter, family [Thermoleophilaceae bacterium]MEA2353599.1 zinc transporter, family [Thermoleophilaceae bacterium]MEA2367619.1 zinc transporter, family [Thermoleophilaceae bacterium]
MSFAQTVLLGGLAGFTIYLGLPVGRLQTLSPRVRVALAMFSVGILAFIFVDVLSHANEIVEGALDGYKNGNGSFGHLAGLVALLIGGFAFGSAGLGIIERRLRPARPDPPPVRGGSGEVALTPSESTRLAIEADDARRRALQTGIVIATAIGLHNFAEGLAIGVSARAGEISLATVLIVGFALHNATEGFGIVGPLGSVVPSWRWIGLVGLIGGGPTFLGAMAGYKVTSQPLELAFYALAAGAILYVIGEIWQGMRRYGYRELGLILLAAGFAAGILTDLVVAYGGG